jgi:hypothetical protein
MSKARQGSTITWWLLGSLLFTALYYYGAWQQSTKINTNMDSTDQSAYMIYSLNMVNSNYTYIGERSRMPVYPFLQALFYQPDMSLQEFFEQGKWLNLALSILLLYGLLLILIQWFPPAHATGMTLVTAFSVFIYKAPYFQAELLYYFVSFCAFVLMWRFLVKPHWQLAIVVGLVSALAHLTKASILPGLLLFLFFSLLQIIWFSYRQRAAESALAGVALSPLQCSVVPVNRLLRFSCNGDSRRHLISWLLIVLVFLGALSPYLYNSKRVFGAYFFNVNSAYFMWYDSWAEARETEVYRWHISTFDLEGFDSRPNLPPELLPGPQKYVREHTVRQMADRLITGVRAIAWVAINSYGYFTYLFLYTVFGATAMVLHSRRAREKVRRNFFVLLFFASYFMVYLLLYAWYTPIDVGNRFTLSLFLPYLFAVSLPIAAFYEEHPVVKVAGLEVKLLNLVLFSVFAVDLYFTLTSRVGTMYGGS